MIHEYSAAESLGRIERLVSTEPTSINGVDGLTEHLRGVSDAASCVLGLEGAEDSMQALVDVDGKTYTFRAYLQPYEWGIKLGRVLHDSGGWGDHIVVPSDAHLSEYLEDWVPYTERRDDRDIYADRDYDWNFETFRPFDLYLEGLEDPDVHVDRIVLGYTEVLHGLAKTLLNVRQS